MSVSTVHHTHGRRLAWLHTVQVEADGGGAAAGARGQWHGVRHPEGGWAHGLQCPGAVGAPQSVAEAEAEAALVIRLCVMFSQRLNQSRAVVTMGQRLATGPGPALALHYSRRHCFRSQNKCTGLSPRGGCTSHFIILRNGILTPQHACWLRAIVHDEVSAAAYYSLQVYSSSMNKHHDS